MSLVNTDNTKPSLDGNIRYTFRKDERLCSQTAIASLIRDGKTVKHYPFRLMYKICQPEENRRSPFQLAIAVPKRNFKRAVKRNLLKRRIREAYRFNKASLYQLAETKNIHVNLLLVYVSTEILSYSEIEQKLIALLQRLSKRLEESNSISVDTAS